MSSLRKKRNFKGLGLSGAGTESSSSPEPSLVAAPDGSLMRKAPPPMLSTSSSRVPSHSHDSPNATPNAQRNLHATLSTTLANMDLSRRKRFDLKRDELKNIEELGMGNGGSVMKVEHVASGTIMAKKIVLIDAKPSVRKQILRELQIMSECDSPYIVSSFGAFLAAPNICICMEYMDKGSFDSIYKKMGPIDIEVVSMVALSVLEGLTYLYNTHKIIHRDIKPSNILCNSSGAIKLCDFGVSGELINSIAHTFVGTSIYMSPERIQGDDYSVKSDVWSLGITIIELAHGRFPFADSYDSDDEADFAKLTSSTHAPSESHDGESLHARSSRRKSKGVSLHGGGMTMSIIELMHQIVKEPAPRLGPEGRFPKEAEDFVDACLMKDIGERSTPGQLIEFTWINTARLSSFDFKAWTETF